MKCLPGSQAEHDGRHSTSWRALVVAIGVALVLVGCGTDSGSDVPEDRQFANEPAPTRSISGTPDETPTQAPADKPIRNVIATPADLLRTRGAPSTLYTVWDGELVVLDTTGKETRSRTIDLPVGSEILGLAASPTGDRAGVLVTADDETPVVQFFDSRGNTIAGPFGVIPSGTPEASPAATPIATPDAIEAIPASESMSETVDLSWAPQGDGVLVVLDNALYYVDVEMGVQGIPTGGVQGTILSAAASPMGGRVLIQVSMDDGSQEAYLYETETSEVRELHALRTTAGTGIGELTWLPGGNGVVFVRGEAIDGHVMRGQLFSYRFRDEVPRLVATSGQGGPSATITRVALTPDGNAVAYAVSILDADNWSLHSMWVRSLKEDESAIEVPVESGDTLTDIGWSGDGLMWGTEPRFRPGARSLHVMTPSGDVIDVTPASAPVASPATPIGSPRATPVATPIGSPATMATPTGT
jgi:hypothetical protein